MLNLLSIMLTAIRLGKSARCQPSTVLRAEAFIHHRCFGAKGLANLVRPLWPLALAFLSLPALAQVSAEDLSRGFQWRNIGPANQGGRIVDIEALNDDFKQVIMATGSGGVWKSDNAGTSWKPIFDHYETASIGDIAWDQSNPEIIWVGSGEANNRNSVSWGNGVYKSTDGGVNFENVGLQETHQIARLAINPSNSDEVCACAIGHLWGYSGDRGLFRTTDGGKKWKKLKKGLPNDGKTGCIDLIQNPNNQDIMYAAFYHRLRQPWTFTSGGGQGGIYKTEDGGDSWRKLTNGLPEETGRIGLAAYAKNPDILMAIVEAPKTDTLAIPGSGIYRSEDGGEHWEYVNTYNNRPFYYSQIRINPLDDQRVYVLTTSFMVSHDGGKTFENGSKDQEVHGDFHALWVDPHDRDRYYLGADKGMSITHDHGRNFTLFDNFAIGQFYRIGYDMRDPYYVYGGLQDNGMYGIASFSRDARGILNDSNWKLHWGDGQYINVDPDNWRQVFTSMENGAYFDYDPLTHRINRISPSPKNIVNFSDYYPELPADLRTELRFNWSSPMWLSPHNANVLYGGGNYLYRSQDKGKSWRIISPDLSTNHPQKRVQGKSGGMTPDNSGAETHCSISTLAISPISENIIWAGTDDGNVQLTRDGGKSWTNLRTNIPKVPAGIWVSRIEACHFNTASAYITFDGHRSDHFGTWVFRTDDYGQSWSLITKGLWDNEVVRVIRQDPKNPNLLFLGTETGVWWSLTGGNQWHRLMPNLPTVSVYDLKIHPRDDDLIAGTHGRSIWVMDDITPWQQMNEQILKGPGHLFDQRTATIWENVSRGGQRGHFWFAGENPKTIENTTSKPRAGFISKAAVSYFLGSDVKSAQLIISDFSGEHQHVVEVPLQPGIQRYYWNLEFDTEMYSKEQYNHVDQLFADLVQRYNYNSLKRLYKAFKEAKTPAEQRKAAQPLTAGYLSVELGEEYLMPKAAIGTYKLTLKVDGQEYTNTLTIREDPLLKE